MTRYSDNWKQANSCRVISHFAEIEILFIDGSVFVGDSQLESLKSLKSKQDRIGGIIGLLQSPARNVLSTLNAGNKPAALPKALEERAN